MFDLDIYICLICFYPIIFRYKPPQVFHLGTGWYCWRKQREDEEEGKGDEDPDSDKIVTCKIPQTTPLDVREKLHAKAKELYGIFCRTGDAAPLLDFVMTQLENDRADVVQDLFAFLAMQGKGPCRDMVYIIVSLSNWREFVVHLRDQAKKKYREQVKKERQRLVKEKSGK